MLTNAIKPKHPKHKEVSTHVSKRIHTSIKVYNHLRMYCIFGTHNVQLYDIFFAKEVCTYLYALVYIMYTNIYSI